MKIGIDVFGCGHGKSGLGAYVNSLVRNLPTNTDCTYELYGHEIDRYTFDPGDGSVSFTGISIPDNPKSEKFWYNFTFKSFVKKQKYDVVLFPADLPQVKLSSRVPTVLVVHTILSNLLNTPSNKLVAPLIIKNLKRAKKIIAVSHFIKKDLIKLRLDPNKIEVIYDGVEHSLLQSATELDNDEDIAYIQPFSIKRPYITYASRLSSSEKKHPELIKAFCEFKKRTNLPHKLVLVGNEEKYASTIHEEIKNCAYAEDILVTGHFPQESFYKLYALSDACVFPSVNEGVGLPVIEAMSCSLPVACSKQGSLGEIAGDFALYFDPDNIEEFSASIERIVSDEELRERLIKGGLEWTKRFTWDKTAQKTLDLLGSIVKKR